MSLNVLNHFQDCGGGETDVIQGIGWRGRSHGEVEVGVRGDSQEDEQVPKHGHKVHGY